MKNENIKQIICKLGRDERYNVCPKCGREVYLYIDEEGEYCVGCLECDEYCACYDLANSPEQHAVDACRKFWNLWAVNGEYSLKALDQMPMHGVYVVTNTSDGFIEFVGNSNNMFEFLDEQKKQNDQALYMIYAAVNGRLLNLGMSHLIELTVSNYREKAEQN